jgi:hypothetical protein
MTTRLNTLDTQNWLHIDRTYLCFYNARLALLRHNPGELIQYWANNQLAAVIDSACRDTLKMIVEHLTTTYPRFFSIKESKIYNHITNDIFDMQDEQIKPLEIAACLVNEDLNILLPFDNDNLVSDVNSEIPEFRLVATATLFPAGWNPRERIGWTIQKLHGPVPGWNKQLGRAVPNALRKIAFGITQTGKSAPEQERLAVFPQADQLDKPLGDLLCIRNGDDFFPMSCQPLTADNILLRREQQSFRRLEYVNGVLFTVRTDLSYLEDIDTSEVEEFTRQVLMLPEHHAAYKKLYVWYPCLRDHCNKLGIDVGRLETEAEVEKEERKNARGKPTKAYEGGQTVK